MTKWTVLAVDDKVEITDQIEQALEDPIGENEFDVIPINSFQEAMDIISSQRFDLAILDVHQDDTDPDPNEHPDKEDQAGELILNKLRSIRFVPVIFYTGFKNKVEHLESSVVKVVSKGEPLENLLNAVSSSLETRIPHLLKFIEEKSRDYMWGSFSKLPTDIQGSIDPKETAVLLARQLANNLTQEETKRLVGIETDSIIPIEMYLYPVDRGYLFTSDIIEDRDGSRWMIMTAACEIGDAQVLTCARVYKLSERSEAVEFVAETKANESLPADKQRSKNKNILYALLADSMLRYKFLPGTAFIEDSIVDFQEICTIPKNPDEFNIVCTLDPPYREEVMQKFANYYGRIGTKDYDKKEVRQNAANKLLA